jgi:hypothetical protein
MTINGNVYGKNVVGKHLIMEMVNYIGGKKVKKRLDMYTFYVVYSGIRDEK